MKFLDANVFLRYLTRDDPVKAEACFALLQDVKRGLEQVTTCEVILHEVLYVLTSRAQYGLSHAEAVGRLRPLLTLRGLKLPRKRVYLRALDLYASSPFLDFGDALAVAHMENLGIQEILSYDSDFDRVESVTRSEPALRGASRPSQDAQE
ncbi:MAG: PIN domain-containing protein [Chloroflexota bacterium]|nr:MAG: PIN domain-containing protein [Chloroflexota bacterium]